MTAGPPHAPGTRVGMGSAGPGVLSVLGGCCWRQCATKATLSPPGPGGRGAPGRKGWLSVPGDRPLGGGRRSERQGPGSARRPFPGRAVGWAGAPRPLARPRPGPRPSPSLPSQSKPKFQHLNLGCCREVKEPSVPLALGTSTSPLSGPASSQRTHERAQSGVCVCPWPARPASRGGCDLTEATSVFRSPEAAETPP